MQADEALVSYIASTYYEMSPILGSIKQLPGYDDRNFLLTDAADNKTYVLKIVNRNESSKELTDIIDEILSGAYDYCQTKRSLAGERASCSHFVIPRLIKTTGNKLSTLTTVKYKRVDSKQQLVAQNDMKLQNEISSSSSSRGVQLEELFEEEVKCNIKLSEYFDGMTIFDYINAGHCFGSRGHSKAPIKSANNKLGHYERLCFRLGKLCNQLFVFLRAQMHLIENLKQIRNQHAYPWQLTGCESYLHSKLDHLYPIKSSDNTNRKTIDCNKQTARRRLIEQTLEEFAQVTRPKLRTLPEFILHSDLCNKNILIKQHDERKPASKTSAQNSLNKKGEEEEEEEEEKEKVDFATLCLIDFQDLQVGPQVIDLAVMILYQILEQEHLKFEKALKLIPRWIYSGYQSTSNSYQLSASELLLVPSLMKLRLSQSLLNGQLAHEKDPENVYVMHTNQRGWTLLELLSNEKTIYGRASELTNLWLTTPLETDARL